MKTLLIAALVMAACSSSPKPTAPPTGSGAEPNHAACSVDADCVVVETACCDHCNGGKAEAFNKAHADAHRPSACTDIACTEMGCGRATASCEAGACKVTIESL